MEKQTLSIAASVSSLILASCYCSCLHAIEPEKLPTTQLPNIVLILADDLGINDLGCYGRSDHRTPNLDQLAANGLRYESCYCSQPICSPSRASIMTGKAPARLHLTNFLPGRANCESQLLLQPLMEGQLALEEMTIAEVLKTAGYTSGLFGKWHLGGKGFGPIEQGFDVAFQPPSDSTPTSSLKDLSENMADIEGGKSEWAITRAAIEFISECKEKRSGQPFFCYVAHNTPHIKLAAHADDISANPDAFNPTYAAMIENLDSTVGAITDTLDHEGLRENTIVIFASDNGGLHVLESPDSPATYNAPFRAGKGFLYEGGIRIPLIVSWPGKLRQVGVISTPVVLTDLMPTMIEATGISIAKSVGPLDGKSLLANWLQSESSNALTEALAKRQLYWHMPHYSNQGSRPAAAIRDGSMKLIEHYEDGRVELYNLDEDPGESNDLSKSDLALAVAMQEKLARWRQRVGAQVCTENPTVNKELHRSLYLDVDVSKLGQSTDFSAAADPLREWQKAMKEAIREKPVIVTDPTQEIRLLPSQATTHGKMLRYEPETYKNVIGYWTEVDDWVDWRFDVPVASNYDIELHYGCGDGNEGSAVDLIVADKTFSMNIQSTGGFQNIIIQNLGSVNLATGANTIEVHPRSKPSVAVMDIRRIVLRRH